MIKLASLKIIAAAILLLIVGGIGLRTFAANDSVNVSLEIACPGDDCAPSGGGGGPPPPPPPPPPPSPILGCTDSDATNYNASATQDDGSCVYPSDAVPNVSDFDGEYDEDNEEIDLSWTNPDFPEFASVRIMRSTSFFPTNPSSGDLVYTGSGESAVDNDVEPGTTYYYAIFVRNTNGDYSSGAVTSVNVPEPEEEPPEEEPEDEEPPVDEDGNGIPDDEEPPDPFADLPQAPIVDPLVEVLNFGDFIFVQPGEGRQFFGSGSVLRINGKKDLTVLLEANKVPGNLKTIAITLRDPSDWKKTFSFLLKLNETGTAYTATIAPLGRSGNYPVYISIVDFQNQSIKRIEGRLLVAAAGAAPIANIAGRIASPFVVASGLILGVAEGFSLVAHIKSFSDLYWLLLHGFNLITRFFGFRKKVKPWGVVYDSVTKRPLDPAYVIVKQSDSDVNTAITDLDGRYGFLLQSGTYSLMANKTHYQFPSVKLAGRTSDELYDNLYHGGDFQTLTGEVINRNIPLDPIAFDWNEFAKDKQGFFILHTKKEKRRARLLNGVFIIGFALSAYNLVFNPSWLNILAIAFYLATPLGRLWWRHRRPVVQVKSLTSGLPSPYAIVKAFIPKVNQQVRQVVADQLGRFFLLTPPGEYYLTVEEKQDDGTYKKVLETPPLLLSRGVLDKNLVF